LDDFNGTYDNVLREYEDSGANALIFTGLTVARHCALCESPGQYGISLRPLGDGRWTCAGCEPLAA
jgi:hypothetical protein